MTGEEIGRALGRIEGNLEAIHERLDKQILPGCQKHDSRIRILEKVLYTTQGVFLIGAAGLIIGKDLAVEWLKRKIAGH